MITTNHNFASNFFESALKSGSRFSHAYLLTGSDILAQYNLAMRVAKTLNCNNKGSVDNCNCTSCSWISKNRHPAVITISPIDYTYGNEQSKSKTVITVNQAKYLRKELSSSSQYHRVIIFTDATEGKEYEKTAQRAWVNYQAHLCPPPIDADEERSSWIPQPLNYKMFQSETANALLKTIEEPPPNVTFFFLVKDKEEMIATIVSRCQAVPVLAENIEKMDIGILSDFLTDFPPQDHYSAVLTTEKLLAFAKQQSISNEELLDMIQEYLHRLMPANHNDKSLVINLIKYIKKVENAKQSLKNYVSPQAVMDSLFLSFEYKMI